MWLTLFTMKDEATSAIIRLQAGVESESSCKLQTLRMDHEGDFTSGSVIVYFAKIRVEHHLTVPYSPQHNGFVEQHNQTIVGMAHSLMKAKKVPCEFWGERCDVYVHLELVTD